MSYKLKSKKPSMIDFIKNMPITSRPVMIFSLMINTIMVIIAKNVVVHIIIK